MVVGPYHCKVFYFSDSPHSLDFGDDDLLFFLDGRWLLLGLRTNWNDEFIFIDLQFIEVSFGVNEFERLRPITLFSSMGTHAIKEIIIIP